MIDDKYYFYLVEDKNDPLVFNLVWPKYISGDEYKWIVYSPDFNFVMHAGCGCGCLLSCSADWDNEEMKASVLSNIEFNRRRRKGVKPLSKLNRKNYFYISIKELKLKELLM